MDQISKSKDMDALPLSDDSSSEGTASSWLLKFLNWTKGVVDVDDEEEKWGA